MGVLAGLEGQNGLKVSEAIEEYYENEVTHWRLYPNLDTLKDGVKEKGQVAMRTDRDDRTDQGREAIANFRDWRAQYLE